MHPAYFLSATSSLRAAAAVLVSITLSTVSSAAEDPQKNQWLPIHEGTGGVAVDRTNGHAYIVVTGKEIFKERGQGIWKSTDAGVTFSRVDGDIVAGRCETGYGLCLDPNNAGRLYCFMLDGPS